MVGTSTELGGTVRDDTDIDIAQMKAAQSDRCPAFMEQEPDPTAGRVDVSGGKALG